MFDITALGELLIDFTPCGTSDTGMKLLEMNPGGAVANVLCAASRLGLSTAFIGKVGDDAHGRYLKNKLDGYGIDTAGLAVTDQAPTTLAFVDIDENGERSFSFIRNPGADILLSADELPEEILTGTRIFHVGSLSMTDQPACSATLEALRRAKASGAVITYDPNYRQMLWRSEQEAATQMRAIVPFADMIKLSDSETVLLTCESDPERAIGVLTEAGAKCAVVTAGEEGSYVGAGGRVTKIDSFRCSAVDTTGAGDAFWGGFLTAFIRSGAQIDTMTADDAAGFAVFGSAVAACSVARRGAMPAMPDEQAVQEILKEHGQ